MINKCEYVGQEGSYNKWGISVSEIRGIIMKEELIGWIIRANYPKKNKIENTLHYNFTK